MADNIDSRISQFVFSETERAVKKEASLNRRVTKIEELVGARSVKDDIESYITTNLNDSDKVPTAGSVKQAIDNISFSEVVDDNNYQTHLATLTDKMGNILAFFDLNGNFHVNGAVISTNL